MSNNRLPLSPPLTDSSSSNASSASETLIAMPPVSDINTNSYDPSHSRSSTSSFKSTTSSTSSSLAPSTPEPRIPLPSGPIHFTAQLHHPLNPSEESLSRQSITLFRSPFDPSYKSTSFFAAKTGRPFPNIYNANDKYRQVHDNVANRILVTLATWYSRVLEDDFKREFGGPEGNCERFHLSVQGCLTEDAKLEVEWKEWMPGNFEVYEGERELPPWWNESW